MSAKLGLYTIGTFVAAPTTYFAYSELTREEESDFAGIETIAPALSADSSDN